MNASGTSLWRIFVNVTHLPAKNSQALIEIEAAASHHLFASNIKILWRRR